MSSKTFTLKEYKRNEHHNDHTLNALRLVQTFGTETEVLQIQQIQDAHSKQGFLTVEQTTERLMISNKYYKLLK